MGCVEKRGLNMLVAFARWVVFPCVRAFFVRRVTGLELLPQPPFVVVANHTSYVDGLLLGAVLAPRVGMVCFVVWKRLECIPVLGWLIKAVGGVFENGSMTKLFGVLARGGVVGIFPEGSRSHDGRIQRVTNSGLGVLASIGVPVVPVRLVGAFELWPWDRRFPRLKRMVEVRVGVPIKYAGKKNLGAYVKFGNQVMQAVGRL